MRTLITLLRLMKPARFLPGILAGLFAALFSALLLGASAYIIASAALMPPLASLALAITMVRACGLFRAVFRYGERLLSHQATFSLLTDLRLAVYRRAVPALPSLFGEAAQGALLHDVSTGVDILRDFYLRAIAPPLLACLLTLFAVLMLVPYGFVALVPPFAFVLCMVLAYSLQKNHASKQEKDADSKLRVDTLDLLAGQEELFVNPQAKASFATHLFHAMEAREEARSRRVRASRWADTSAQAVMLLAFWCAFFFLLLETMHGRLTGIWLAVYTLALESILSELTQIPEAVRAFFRGQQAARAILQKLSAQEDASAKKFETLSFDAPPTLEVRNLTFAYPKQGQLFPELSFIVRPKEKIAILGESGVGKTTLFHLLTRLFQPTTGEIFLNHVPYTKLSLHTTRRAFAATSQSLCLFDASLKENFLRFCPQLTEDQMWQALRQASLEEEVRAQPRGLGMRIGVNGAFLSGGQRQRLLIAIALAKDAPILLLDEPTAGLDAQTSVRLLQGILDACADKSLIIITHDERIADNMPRTITLHRS